MKKITICFFIILFSTILYAQKTIKSTFEGRHHAHNSNELNVSSTKNFTSTPAPVGEVRNIAEFEYNEGIIVAYRGWGFGIPLTLIKEIAEDAMVITIVKDTEEANEVKEIYSSYHIDLENCSFLYAINDSYWCRDYSPWFIAVDNEVALVDFPYNRSRPNDDEIPIKFADNFDMDLYGMNLIHTGGNWMCDGMGVAASTDLVYTENPNLSKDAIEQLVKEYLGVDNYYVKPDPQQDYIKHIDCWGKFLDVDKILIAKVKTTDSRYYDYESMANFWASQKSSYGNNYQVYRVYSPNSQPYTNSLIVNNKVMVPLVSGYGGEYNQEAIDIYKNAMPGYEIIGFYDNGSEYWESTDALHCRTHEVPDRNMLYIHHKPLLGEQISQSSYTIKAQIIPYSKTNVAIAKLYYSINNSSFNEAIMDYEGDNTFTANIPISTSKSANNNISYYIFAEDESGKQSTHPYIAEADPHSFITSETTNYDYVISPKFEISAYPNPIKNNYSFISLRSNKPESIILTLLDVQGKVHKKEFFDIHAGNYIYNLDVSELNNGVYYIHIKTDDKYFTEKVLIQK